jgi:hypothetical protein
MPALMPRAAPAREDDSALVRVLEASIETLKAENEILRRRLAAAEARATQETAAEGANRRVFRHHETAQGAGRRPWRRARGISAGMGSTTGSQQPAPTTGQVTVFAAASAAADRRAWSARSRDVAGRTKHASLAVEGLKTDLDDLSQDDRGNADDYYARVLDGLKRAARSQ